MHLLLPKRRYKDGSIAEQSCRLLLLTIAVLSMSACASNGISRNTPANVESRDVSGVPNGQLDDNGCWGRECVDQGDIAHVLPQQNASLDRARYFEAQAGQRNNVAAQIDATLNAAEYYVQAEQSGQAVALIQELKSNTPLTGLSDVQRDRINVVYAYHSYSNHDYQRALSILAPLMPAEQLVEYVDPRTLPEYQQRIEQQSQENPYTDGQVGSPDSSSLETEREVIEQPRLVEMPALSPQQVDALLLSSFCYRELGQFDQQINALIQREQGVRGEAQAQSTRYTWQVINALPEFTREQIIAQTELTRIKPRLEQSLMGQTGGHISNVKQFTSLPRELNANTAAERKSVEWNTGSIRQIAVLLPLSSKYNKAATALLDGIKFEHELQRGAYSPELLVYDIGEDPYQTSQYYQAAVNQGAEFILGPLGKDFADQLLVARSQYPMRNSPALVMGGSAPLDGGTNRFEFSPEREGIMVARKAFSDGHLSAAVIVANDPKSARIKQGFEREWLSLGGRITAQTQYSTAQFDHTVELKLLFKVGASDNRAKRLSDVLGYKPEHTAYQRGDIDFVFMIADARTGRLLRPQINYFSASSIPVYAGLDVYTGVADAINDMDLEGTLFPVMPWVLRSEKVSQYAGQFNQLFALGADAYRVASQYDKLSQRLTLSENQVIEGYTGLLRLRADGNIDSEPLWASFNEGLAKVSDNEGFDLTPMSNELEADPDSLDSGSNLSDPRNRLEQSSLEQSSLEQTSQSRSPQRTESPQRIESQTSEQTTGASFERSL